MGSGCFGYASRGTRSCCGGRRWGPQLLSVPRPQTGGTRSASRVRRPSPNGRYCKYERKEESPSAAKTHPLHTLQNINRPSETPTGKSSDSRLMLENRLPKQRTFQVTSCNGENTLIFNQRRLLNLPRKRIDLGACRFTPASLATPNRPLVVRIPAIFGKTTLIGHRLVVWVEDPTRMDFDASPCYHRHTDIRLEEKPGTPRPVAATFFDGTISPSL